MFGTSAKIDRQDPVGSHASGLSSLAALQGGGDALLAWLTPSAKVRLLQAAGGASVWRATDTLVPAPGEEKSEFLAIEIPEELFLARKLFLPRMSAPDMEAAILLEVNSKNPFASEDLAWGFAYGEVRSGRRQVDVALASRRQINDFLATRPVGDAAVGQPVEVWALAGLATPVVISGYGESSRLELARRGRLWNCGLLILCGLLATLAALTPVAQLALRASEAGSSLSELVSRVAPLTKKRDELALIDEQIRTLEIAAADRISPTAVMELLAGALPDDTYLYSLDIKSSKIIASGHTVDASALLQRLSADPRLRDVRSPAAVTRQPGAVKEAFTVEFVMAGQELAARESAASAKLNGSAAGSPALVSPASSPFVAGGAR